MILTADQKAHLRRTLQVAIVKCSERCLYQSAKWVAELLDALPVDEVDIQTSADCMHLALALDHDAYEAGLEARELSKYLLAKSFFDCKEFERCAAVFLPETLMTGLMTQKYDDLSTGKGKGKESGMKTPQRAGDLPEISQKSLFLALYAKVLAGEKQKDEDTEMVMGPHDMADIKNKQLLVVGRYLEQWFAKRRSEEGEIVGSQGFLEYLFGANFISLGFKLTDTDTVFPWNWSCWQEITNLVNKFEDLTRIVMHLPQNIMSFIFHAHTSIHLYHHNRELSAALDDLLNIFPLSSFLLTCRAMLNYHAKELLLAEQNFSHLLCVHPHRLESLDHYSNILYVLNLRPKLAFLAHLCTGIDRFRPESCVVVGNYFSLLSLHEKAVKYFRRAITLDRSCLSAWTLMGHEYVELKNSHSAIEAYRRAVDANRRDYRAWYGLGQTYEMLEMHAYALWYYKKAAGLRPWDSKMWQAVGSCLEKIGREQDAIKALKRALLADSYYDSTSSSFGSDIAVDRIAQMDPDILLQIANLYERINDVEEAKAWMEVCVAQEDGGEAVPDPRLDDSFMGQASADTSAADEGGRGERGGHGGYGGTGVTVATSKARMWLARFAMRTEDYATATRLATELCQDGVDIEEAKSLIMEAKSRLRTTEVDAG